MRKITHKVALARGWSRYFTGKPCGRGHIAERYTLNKGCVLCARISRHRYRRSSKGLEAKWQWTHSANGIESQWLWNQSAKGRDSRWRYKHAWRRETIWLKCQPFNFDDVT